MIAGPLQQPDYRRPLRWREVAFNRGRDEKPVALLVSGILDERPKQVHHDSRVIRIPGEYPAVGIDRRVNFTGVLEDYGQTRIRRQVVRDFNGPAEPTHGLLVLLALLQYETEAGHDLRIIRTCRLRAGEQAKCLIQALLPQAEHAQVRHRRREARVQCQRLPVTGLDLPAIGLERLQGDAEVEMKQRVPRRERDRPAIRGDRRLALPLGGQCLSEVVVRIGERRIERERRARPAFGVIQPAEMLAGKRKIAQYERVLRVESRGLLQLLRRFLDATQPEIAEPEHVAGPEVRRRRPQHLQTVRNGVVEVAALKRRFGPCTQRRYFRDDGYRDCTAALFVLPAAAARAGIVTSWLHTDNCTGATSFKHEATSYKQKTSVQIGGAESVGSVQRRIKPCSMREISIASWIIALACRESMKPASSPIYNWVRNSPQDPLAIRRKRASSRSESRS